MQNYLAASQYIDHDHAAVRALAKDLAQGRSTDREIAAACFALVRDEIRHSVDFKLNPVTCKASDVLRRRAVPACSACRWRCGGCGW
ncbi:hypothetical protein [Pseudorhodoferax sp. Leaf265]|uniref:hypothetical protein n=1 Tax=Pseudorhodoferax sp. Leaf265 TaxID=1736315 RepID=UPI0012E7C915|nr:hypothetical protein [Pseudorhodoferax sp. Leaf265]